ncbi:unnamed protein product [marine sediment metagenome]|uniref:Uncharacterized protein n=1 Tax=marine sediment metagenome TaxID=412755 RepID=X0XJM5_9ZZZZ
MLHAVCLPLEKNLTYLITNALIDYLWRIDEKHMYLSGLDPE